MVEINKEIKIESGIAIICIYSLLLSIIVIIGLFYKITVSISDIIAFSIGLIGSVYALITILKKFFSK